MVGFICFFFPPVIAVVLTVKRRKEGLRYDQYLGYYSVFTVIINGTLFWILTFLFEQHSISAPDVFTTSFSAKYILLSSIIAVISANILESFHRFRSKSKDIHQENIAENKNEGS